MEVVRFQARVKRFFLFFIISNQTLGPSQPSIQGLPAAPFPGRRKLTTHRDLVPRLHSFQPLECALLACTATALHAMGKKYLFTYTRRQLCCVVCPHRKQPGHWYYTVCVTQDALKTKRSNVYMVSNRLVMYLSRCNIVPYPHLVGRHRNILPVSPVNSFSVPRSLNAVTNEETRTGYWKVFTESRDCHIKNDDRF